MSGPERKTRKDTVEQVAMFDMGPAWADHWWGMPAFDQGDARPLCKITVNFLTLDDLHEFRQVIGIAGLTVRTDSIWFPPENVGRPKDWVYTEASDE